MDAQLMDPTYQEDLNELANAIVQGDAVDRQGTCGIAFTTSDALRRLLIHLMDADAFYMAQRRFKLQALGIVWILVVGNIIGFGLKALIPWLGANSWKVGL